MAAGTAPSGFQPVDHRLLEQFLLAAEMIERTARRIPTASAFPGGRRREPLLDEQARRRSQQFGAAVARARLRLSARHDYRAAATRVPWSMARLASEFRRDIGAADMRNGHTRCCQRRRSSRHALCPAQITMVSTGRVFEASFTVRAGQLRRVARSGPK